jgi:hypothetical protein
MDAAKNTQNKRKRIRRKGTPITKILRAFLFITIGLLIVFLYYLYTKDKLLIYILQLSSAFITFIKSIPMPIYMMIGYTILIFYVGYLVGKRRG